MLRREKVEQAAGLCSISAKSESNGVAPQSGRLRELEAAGFLEGGRRAGMDVLEWCPFFFSC